MAGALTDYVTLTLTAENVGIARAGFGVPLILSHSATWTERTRSYGSTLDVAADFATDTPEYLAAAAMFAQSPAPTTIMIGRAALAPTQVYVIGAAAVTNSTAYKVNVVATGATVTNPLVYTSDSSATNDEIIGGLVTALNGVTGKNYTAAATGSVGSQVCTVTGTAAADWFSIEVLDPTLLSIKQTHADPGVATDLAAIALENSNWYALTMNFNSQAYVTAAAAWIEDQAKIYLFDVNETAAITTTGGAGGSADTLDALATLKRTRTAGSYHPSPAAFMSAAWLGRVLPDDPGTETWKFKTLSGVPAVNLTATNRTNLRARHANTIETVAGRNITWDGTTSDGQFIDVRRGLDWLQDDMSKGVFGVLAGNEKVPFTDAGVAMVENEVQRSLTTAVAKGILAASPAPVVTAPLVSTISATNKSARLLPDIRFTGTLAGAVHAVSLIGVVAV